MGRQLVNAVRRRPHDGGKHFRCGWNVDPRLHTITHALADLKSESAALRGLKI